MAITLILVLSFIAGAVASRFARRAARRARMAEYMDLAIARRLFN